MTRVDVSGGECLSTQGSRQQVARLGAQVFRSFEQSRRVQSVAEVLEDHVLPKIARALSAAGPTESRTAAALVSDEDLERAIDTLVLRVLAGRVSATQDVVGELLDQGLPETTLYMDVLSIVAQRLGRMWDRDKVHFTQVAIGLGVLELLYWWIQDRSPDMEAKTNSRRSAIFGRAKNEQHTFGLVTLQRIFEKAGWRVSGGSNLALGPAFVKSVSAHWFAIAGISVGSSRNSSEVAGFIRKLRRRSKNPRIHIMVGGALFIDGTVNASDLGADLTADNAELAVEAAESIVDRAYEHIWTRADKFKAVEPLHSEPNLKWRDQDADPALN